MEDAVDALKMAFSVFVFILGLSIVFNMFSKAREVSDYVLEHTDNTYFAKYANADASNDEGRTVGIETIIPTLYRYYKEKFAIDVIVDAPETDSTGKYKETNEKFDEEVERIVYTNADGWKEYEDLYSDGISWLGNPNIDTQKRVTAYIDGGSPAKPYPVNDSILSKYTKRNRNLKDWKDSVFTETFTQKDNSEKKYNGEDGSVVYLVKGTTKLHITYTLQKP